MYSWTCMKRSIDEFLIGADNIPQGTDPVEIYNLFADYLSKKQQVCLRNPANSTRVLGYLTEHCGILWDAGRKEALRIMTEADRRFEKRNSISL